MVITEQQADDLLKWDVSKCLSQVFTVSPILINSGGKKLNGLGLRREVEVELFLKNWIKTR
ncbi:hypothetical protein [Candidatus Liberibacter solanacearum]|uniref:hypothetical protein n=1 Tax=Candidatus Liberibacter solanacearum TaxID=556287 RepID=UPI000CDD7B9E|nr:hypothetical protein [Candidatus Liberibacter solanacearum]